MIARYTYNLRRNSHVLKREKHAGLFIDKQLEHRRKVACVRYISAKSSFNTYSQAPPLDYGYEDGRFTLSHNNFRPKSSFQLCSSLSGWSWKHLNGLAQYSLTGEISHETIIHVVKVGVWNCHKALRLWLFKWSSGSSVDFNGATLIFSGRVS
jgi:hypothetical protein